MALRSQGESRVHCSQAWGESEFVQVNTHNAGMLEEALQGQYQTITNANAMQTSCLLWCDYWLEQAGVY